jgi:hypothetical protein
MGLGLLGALQGAGQSMTQFGNALFAEETERQRQAELQKIRDTDYKRGRADQLTDQQTVFNREDTLIDRRNTREDTVRTGNREYDAGLLREANTLYDERLATANALVDKRYSTARQDSVEDKRNIITSVQVDDTGTAFGITATGDMREIGQLANMNPLLRDAITSEQNTLRYIDQTGANEESDPQLFENLRQTREIIQGLFNSSAENMGIQLNAPSAPQGGAEESVALGNLLFSGKPNIVIGDRVISGDELLNYQDKFKQQFPSLYNGMFNR